MASRNWRGKTASRDARAAFDFIKRQLPNERISVLGISLGGAAAVLTERPLEASAMVLEAVYGSFDEALNNRLSMRVGSLSPLLAPLLWFQVEPRLGFNPDVLRPAEAVAKLHVPLLLIAGAEDKHAKLSEMRRTFARANEPKRLWIIEGAAHIDFHRYTRAEYEHRVLNFLIPILAS
jgi:uncharacterized protein